MPHAEPLVSLIVPARDDHQGDKRPTEHVAAYKATIAAAPFQGAALAPPLYPRILG